jgi:hypothetical protein
MLFFRDVVDRAERVFAAAVVDLVDTPMVAGALLDVGKLGATGLRGLDDLRGAAVHLLSLPSHRDVRSLSAQVAQLKTALAEVEARLEDLQLDRAAGPEPR